MNGNSLPPADKGIRGWVYVLSNQSFQGQVKIGYSTKEPVLRAQELGGTGLPYPFVVEYDVLVHGPRQVEQAVHKELRKRGLHESKEFFIVAIADAVKIIRGVIEAQGKTLLLENKTSATVIASGQPSPQEAIRSYTCPKCGAEYKFPKPDCLYCKMKLVPVPIISPPKKNTHRCPRCLKEYYHPGNCTECGIVLVART
jgi:hypothetical protein